MVGRCGGVRCLTGTQFLLFCSIIHLLHRGGFVAAQEQEFIGQPENTTARVGENISLRCMVYPHARVYWLVNGFPLMSNTTYDFKFNEFTGENEIVIKNISVRHDGQYFCRSSVEGSDGSVIRSRSATITVMVPPTQLKLVPFIPSTLLQENVETSLTCSASGKPAPLLQWFKDDARLEVGVDTRSVLDNGTKIENVTSTLKWTPQREDHEKRIFCTASHPALQGGPLRVQTQLNVEYAPVVKLTSKPELVKEGDPVTLVCSVEANPNIDLKFRWTKNGQPVSGSAVGGSLHIDAAQRSEFEQPVVYTCEASNRLGRNTDSLSLDIQFPPSFFGMSEVKGADSNTDVYLTCNVDSNPPATITWTRDTATKVIGTEKILQFSTAGDGDFGVYVCQATAGPNFAPIRKTIRVLKNDRPFINAETSVYAGQGESVQIKCQINGLPGPDTVRWTKVGDPQARVLSGLTDSRIEITQENTNPDRVISHLTIRDVRKEDFGMYNCSASNAYGQGYQLIPFKETDWMVPIIAGSACGGALLLTIIVVSAIFCIRCRSHNRLKEKASDTSGSTTTSDDLDIKSGNGVGVHHHHHGGPLDGMYNTTSHEQLMENGTGKNHHHHHHSWTNGSGSMGRHHPHQQDIHQQPYTIQADYGSNSRKSADTPQNYYTRYADYDPNTEYNPNTFMGLPAIYTPTLSLAEQQPDAGGGQEPGESRDPSPYHPTGLPMMEPVYARYPAVNGSVMLLDASLQSRLATNV